MEQIRDPFVSEAAATLNPEQIIDYYIDDHNNARLIQSKRNVFLIGERGSGKSMTLIFNSFGVQLLKARQEDRVPSLEFIGVLIPCNTPLTHKREYQLLDDFRASVVSEHLFALSIGYAIAATVAEIPDVLDGANEEAIREEVEFVLGLNVASSIPFFRALQLAVDRELVETQRRMNEFSTDIFYEKSLSFATLIMPLLHILRRIPRLSKSHFLLMIDDAHDLNEHQIRALNSWIAYRDRSFFSFKVATAKVGQPKRLTATGGSILESHDYITIDLEEPIHNEDSDFGRLATRIVQRRLSKIGVKKLPDEFFPMHQELKRELGEAESRVRSRAVEQFGDADKRKVSDYVYKQRRAEYFRSRDPKANLPHYSGFSTMVYLSTGLVRNLLEPCSLMFDAVLSDLPSDQRGVGCIQEIPPGIQSRIIQERSVAAWSRLRTIDQFVEGCSAEAATSVYNLLDNLAKHFRERLLSHSSEPGAISFSISGQTPAAMTTLTPLLEIAQRAQMLYVREGPAKSGGDRESYYVPNRILWPVRGLDPHGQYARASIRADVLVQASKGTRIPLSQSLATPSAVQGELSLDELDH